MPENQEKEGVALSRTRYTSFGTHAQSEFQPPSQKPDTKPDNKTDFAADELLNVNNSFMELQHYKTPRIYRGKKEWFVEYKYLNPFDNKTWDRFKVRAKINYEKDLEKREAKIILLHKLILDSLKKGKVPARYSKIKNGKAGNLLDELRGIARSEGLGKSQDTRNGYTLYINRLNKYLHSIENPDIPLDQFRSSMLLTQFTEQRAQEFKEYLVEEMELANVTVNCTIQPIKTFLEVLFTRKKIEINPFYHVKYLPKHRGSTFIAFDHDEKKAIAEELSKNYPELYLFVNLIYACFTRPKENCALTPGDIDLKGDWLQVRIETSKVSHTSYRQIMPGLKKLIIDYGIPGMPKNQVIFKSICGEDDSLRVRRRKVTELWHRVVKKKLGIDKEMYGMKHTGNIDYLKSLDNVGEANLLWLKQQNDHTTLETTQKYIRDLGVYKMKKENMSWGSLI